MTAAQVLCEPADKEVGDGTTSVAAAEFLKTAGELLKGISFAIGLLARKQRVILGKGLPD